MCYVDICFYRRHDGKTWDETESPESYISNQDNLISLKGGLSGLRPCLTTETPLKMMKNVFYFTLKALFVLKIFKFLS